MSAYMVRFCCNYHGKPERIPWIKFWKSIAYSTKLFRRPTLSGLTSLSGGGNSFFFSSDMTCMDLHSDIDYIWAPNRWTLGSYVDPPRSPTQAAYLCYRRVEPTSVHSEAQ
jgi:hypothetical protein